MTTTIEWTDVTWNPVRGCSLVSAGCQNCYAMKQAHRFSGPDQPYEGLTEIGTHGPRWTGKIALDEDALKNPLRWKKPRRIFVNSMSDLFHEDVPDAFIDKVFAVILCAPRHTFQILTKRPQRMLEYMMADNGFGRQGHIWHAAYKVSGIHVPKGKMPPPFPYPHVWLGVSVEDQATADARIPILLQTPGAVRWVSAEPLLGPVAIHGWDGSVQRNYLTDSTGPGIDWVVVGGESGPGARPCDIAWIRSIREQCQGAGVPVFVKQLGARPYQSPERDGGTGFFLPIKHRKGGAMAEWPADLRVREWPR